MNWWVYMILTDNNCLYTGITTDPARRYREHQGASRDSGRGAKFFRNTTPIALVFLENCANRSLASQREYAIKKLTRRNKDALVEENLPSTEAHYQTLGLSNLGIPLHQFATPNSNTIGKISRAIPAVTPA